MVNNYDIYKNVNEQLNIKNNRKYNKTIILKRFLTKSERFIMKSFWTKYEYNTKKLLKIKNKDYYLNKNWYEFMNSN